MITRERQVQSSELHGGNSGRDRDLRSGADGPALSGIGEIVSLAEGARQRHRALVEIMAERVLDRGIIEGEQVGQRGAPVRRGAETVLVDVACLVLVSECNGIQAAQAVEKDRRN